ncbi:MAG TPA: tripartite tricarboxylate transporter TctB family protein [Pseudorhizobium sp.]|jgi:hypothetical protein|nr:tripartite tricarboxylate transporter TctB family protein [Pseudorhizobium sp.]
MAIVSTWALLALFGLGAIVLALDFGHGAGSRIGSAAFPLALAGGIVLVSLWGLVASLVRGRNEEAEPFALRPFLTVGGSIIWFIMTIDRFGMIPATLGSMLLAYAGQTDGRYSGFLLYSAIFAVVVWLVFSVGLGLPVSAFSGR